MKELSQVWDQLTDVSQANILNLVGGKRNGNVVAALLNNFSIAEDVMKTAADSAGSAMAENEKYLDSIAGKIAVLKSSFEELSFDMFDTDLVKSTVDFATVLVNVVDSLAKINMLLPAIVSAVVFIQAVRASNRNAAMQTQGALAAAQIADQLIRERTVSEELKVTYALLNEEVRENIRLKLDSAVASGALEATDRDEITRKLGIAAATNAVGEANKKVAISTKVLSGMTPWGWVGIALSLLPALLSLYERLHKSNDELIQDAKELEDSFASSMSKTVSEIDQIKGLRGEFDELSKGVSDYGKNISLSADEYERYQKIVQTIVGISPSLIEGYDAENKAIVNKNGLIERTIELLEYERKLKLDEYLSDENIITSGKGVVAGINEFIGKGANPYTGEYWADGLLGQMADMAQNKIDSGAVSAIDISGAFGLGDAMRRYATMGGPMVERFFEEYYDQIKDAVYNRNEELRSVFTEEEIDTLEHILQEHDKNVEKYEAELDRRRAGFNPTLQLAAQDAEGYEKLSEAQKSFVSSYIDTFRLNEGDGEDVFKKQRDDVVAFTEALLENEDALKAIEVGNIITTGEDADGESITIDEYRKQLRDFIQYVESIEDPELRVRIVSQYGTSGDDAGIDEAINLAREKLFDTTGITKMTKVASEYRNELEDVHALGLDIEKTKFGNIDLNNRQEIKWDFDNLDRFKKELMSMPENVGKEWALVRQQMLGTTSTVMGGSMNFDGIEIAFSPMLQTPEGAVLLSDSTVSNYIAAVIDKVKSETGGQWTTEDLLRIDAKGLEVDGTHIKNIIADVGDTAIATGQAMHYLGTGGSLAQLERDAYRLGAITEMSKEKVNAVLSGEDADSTAIENFLNNLTVDEAMAIAYELKARDGSMTVEEIEEWLRERKQAIIHLELSESFNAAYDKMKELYDMRDKLKDLAADGSDLDIDTFVELSKLLPDVIGGITDVASAQEALKQKIRESQHDVVNAYGGMVLANDEFIAGVLSNNKALADHMATYYNNDLSRFQEISKGKYAVDQALVQSLSELWAKYSKVSTADIESEINYLKNYVFPQMSKLDNGADNSPAYAQSMQDLRDRLKEAETMLAWRKEIEDKWDELSRTTKSSSSSGKEVDAYIVDIDRYREALERLNNIRINKEDLEQALSATDDLDEKIRLEQELLSVYQAEQATLLEINRLRDQTILEGVDKLTKMGFQVDYDPENDKLFVRNMERINELAASSKGKYGSLQEATNALRKDTEELIETLESLNRENQDGTDDWQALEQSVRDAKVNIVNNLKEVVTQASEAVDAIQGVYDTLKEAADEYAANGGFISVDTFQKIIELGPEYMQYLRDENNQLVINEESINRVIAAKTRQLALEQAMSYVTRIRMALESGSVENLNTLLYATTETTNATWGLVYAELELMHVTGALNDQQYAAALHNIQAIQSLGENAAQNIGRVTGSVVEELNKMKSGLDDLLKYVMDMLRDKIKRQIEDLEEMKDAYADLIAMKKESLEKTDQETKYQDKVAKKVREIQKLQEKINALSLDDSRDAAAQKLKLEEEMAKLQEELAEMQSDNALEIQQDSLDKMQEAYEEEKDKEIEALEDSISSEQKLYDMAIQYIKDNWDDLLSTLTDWNYEYGSSLTSEITTAWENALAAAQKYGDYVTALEQIDADIEQAGGGQSGGSGGIGGNIIVGDTVPPSKPTDEDRVGAIIRQMYRNSKAWNSADKAGKDALNEENRKLGEVDLKRYGITAVRGDDGVWYVDRVGGERLFDRYRKYIYHSGGIVGDVGSLKENELLATMERGEVVVSNRNKDALFSLLDFANLLSKKMDMTGYGPYASVPFSDVRPDISDVVTNNAENIHFGDVYIYGANEDTVEKHREINRQFTNDILRQLNIKK